MDKTEQTISIPLVNEWRIRRPYLYRYLEKQYVDEFFETGKLRLSSFNAFSKHKDEQRMDGSEGHGIVTNVNTEGKGQTIFSVMGQGSNCYVLCSATLYHEEIAKDFGTDSGFRINNTLLFASTLSRYIPGFLSGIEGLCNYLPRRSIVHNMDAIDIESMRISPESKNLDMGKMMQATSKIAGDELLFLKLNRYSSQNEYRLLWHVSGGIDSHIDIICPEARQFCTRFEDLEAEKEYVSDS